jgi:hypothetical protein
MYNGMILGVFDARVQVWLVCGSPGYSMLLWNDSALCVVGVDLHGR